METMTTVNYSAIKERFQPLDLILFRGTDIVSDTICIVSKLTTKEGDFSHCGLLVNKELLPTVPQLKANTWYVWESTFSAVGGLLGHFGDGVPNIETGKGRLGVQIRDFEAVVKGYTGGKREPEGLPTLSRDGPSEAGGPKEKATGGGKVAWAPLLRNPWLIENDARSHKKIAEKVSAIHKIVGNRDYDVNCCGLLAAVIPCLREPRDVFNEIMTSRGPVLVSWDEVLTDTDRERIDKIYEEERVPRELESSDVVPQNIGARLALEINNNNISGWLFCSELVALVYQCLKLIPDTFDPQDVIPVDFLGTDADGLPAMVGTPIYVIPDGSEI